MDLSKSLEWFSPSDVKGEVHIVGCGSVGSCLAELLARFGITNFVLYDFDTVEAKNIANQMFFGSQVGKPKVEALRDILIAINPDCEDFVRMEPNGYTDQDMEGYVFLCVDNIEVRRNIVEANRYNKNIKAMFDIRTGFLDAQHYAASWADPKQVNNLLKTMNFSHEEAKAATPVSACGVTLGLAPTVRGIVNVAVVNFVNFIKTGELKKTASLSVFDLGECHFLAL